MRFAKWVYMLAGISGVLMIAPGFFFEEKFGQDYPPAPNPLELYYGFFGVTVAGSHALRSTSGRATHP